MRSILALFGLAAVAAGFSLGGTQPAQAVCSVLSHHPCTPGVSSVLRGHPYTPTFCSVFHRGPCVPEIIPPIGQDLRLTIVSDNSGNIATNGQALAPAPTAGDSDTGTEPQEHKLNTIRDLFDALRACWVPPPEDEARHGMQMSVRFAFKRDGEIIAPPRVTYASPGVPADAREHYHEAISAALDRCTPLQLSTGLGGAIAGRPIALRVVDNRTVQ
jgi:hypothetical protein